MKISFDTPLDGTDQSGSIVPLSAADIAALAFVVLVDTVNPPVKSYAVPAANVAAATTNTNGSKRITVDAVKDLGIVILENTQYFIEVKDSLGSQVSAPTTVLTFTEIVTPGPVQNPIVA